MSMGDVAVVVVRLPDVVSSMGFISASSACDELFTARAALVVVVVVVAVVPFSIDVM